MVNIIRVKSLPGFLKDLYFTLDSTAKIDLVRLADIAPIFGMGLIEKSSLSSLDAVLGIVRRDKSLFAGDTLTIANGA